ncbi:MAG: hypothetical protein SF053_06835 [Bacteroidia bacterium]|nr:hypothetical protein [Bacteroidia bacterium]
MNVIRPLLILGLYGLLFPVHLLGQTPAFPASWAGNWAGDLLIYTHTGIVQTVPMELRIQPLDSAGCWTWTLVYQVDSPDIRQYLLVPKDTARGIYAIDERDSIVLDAYVFGDFLLSTFSVEKTLLQVSYQLDRKRIIFEITSGPIDQGVVTGQAVAAENGLIMTYPVRGYQRAILKRR